MGPDDVREAIGIADQGLQLTARGAPEQILEELSQFVTTAAGILNPAPPANANMPMAGAMPPGAAPVGPGGPAVPQLAPGAPVQAFNPGAFAPMSA